MNLNRPLPDLLSEIITEALADFKKCIASPERYKIDMCIWYLPKENMPCVVCLAGSVIAQRTELKDALLQFEKYDYPELTPSKMSSKMDAMKLRALDKWRQGDPAIYYIKEWMPNISRNQMFPATRVYMHCDINDGAKLFIADMEQLAADFKACGL